MTGAVSVSENTRTSEMLSKSPRTKICTAVAVNNPTAAAAAAAAAAATAAAVVVVVVVVIV
jgi:hypothetical protein